ncbi:MAG: hypothetical protein H0U74_19150 [Bradymonadaceae bacterium]|nr:hypothetical protein [Lujinxingiaceae bacterium]
MLKNPPPYHSYLLRFWRESGWRFMLENPHTGERKGFGSFEALVAFLQEEVMDEEEAPR